jgi:hypothetical protein
MGGETHIRFWLESLKRKDHLEDLRVNGYAISERMLRT